MLTFEYSEGNDGDWSTFSIRIGNDAVAQNTRVTISTTGPQTLAVLSSVCNGSSSTTCASSRGGTFNISKSSTWNDQGGFNLGLFEANLGYDNVLAEFGLDAVGLGLSAALGPSLESQVVGGITADEYWYGQLGLSVQPTNFTNFASPQPSFFQSLYNTNLIPSLSWAYTAGAKYRNKGVFGSLVFGGYDTSRFSPNSLSFTFASDVTRDLVVGLQSIVSTDSSGNVTTLLEEGILTFVDSTLPYIWLPESACMAFEKAFGLRWNKDQELYLLNSSTHDDLLRLNPNVVFKLGNTISGGPVVSITLPYSAFDLNVTAPLVDGSSYYFPLKRAANDTQYTLGRTFLQEAYLIADYGRQNFSISQCTWDTGARERLVAISSTNDTSNSTTPISSSTSSHHHGLAGGAIAGIVIAALLALAIIALLIYGIHRRRHGLSFFARHPFFPELPPSAEKVGQEKYAELDSKSNLHSTPELEQTDTRLAKDVKHEMPSPPLPLYRSQQGSVTSVSGLSGRSEVPGGPVPVGLMQGVYELGGGVDGLGRAELHAGESGVPRIEVVSPR